MSDCPSCSTGVTVPTAPTFPAFPPPVGPSTPGSSAAVDPCEGIPVSVKVLEDFVAPAQGSQVQIYSQCAYKWAVAGIDLFIAPFGRVSVQNVQDNIMTVINRTIPEGRQIVAGTAMIPANGWDFTNATQAIQLLGLNGNGYPVAISPNSENDIIKAIRGDDNILRWQRSAPAVTGMQFYPNASPVVFFNKDDSAGSFSLPGMPPNNVQCVPLITLNAQITCNNTRNFSRVVTIGGVQIAAISGYYFHDGVYKFSMTCASPGYGAMLAGNPVTVGITDGADNGEFTVNQFDLAVVGWFK